MPGRASVRSALHLGVGRDHGDLVDRRPPALLEQQGDVEHDHRRVRHGRRGRPSRSRATAGWISASSRAQLARARRAPARRGWCDSTPSGPVVPGKCASISATSAPVRPLQPVHRRVGVEHRHAFVGEHPRHGRLAHADRAGEAEDDVMTSAARAARRRARAAAAAPKKCAKAGAACPISIVEAVDRRAARARRASRAARSRPAHRPCRRR